MPPILEAKNLQVARGESRDSPIVLALEQLSVEEGQILAMIGPNGSGKSTALLSLSRAIPYLRGEVYFRGERITESNELAYRRQISLVLQDPLLLDLTVAENVALGMRFRNWPKERVQSQVAVWLRRLGIADLRDRRASRLSGGEAQRTSIARALALEPSLLFLDEPFSSLDRPTRTSLIEDLQVLLRETGTTTILVTHDLNEALALGSKVAVLLAGTVRQVGTAEEVFSTPADAEVAAFVGVETFVPGKILDQSDGLVQIAAGDFRLEIVGEGAPGENVLVCMRPEDLTLWLQDEIPASSARNVLRGRIHRISHQANLSKIVVDCGFPVVSTITRASFTEMQLKEAQDVALTFKATSAHLLNLK